MKKDYTRPEWEIVDLNGEIDTISVSTQTEDGVPEGYDSWLWS